MSALVPELEPEYSLVCLPLRRSGLLPDGVQNFADGNMEAVGVASWPTGGGGGGGDSKSLVSPHSGLQCLRVTNPVSFQFVYNAVPAVVGQTYRNYGWTRGDGVEAPVITNFSGAITYWTGTPANVWQWFDFTAIADGPNWPLFFNTHAAGGVYVDFDDLVREWCPMATPNIGSLKGVATLGDGLTPATYPAQLSPKGMVFDGATDYLSRVDPALSFTDGVTDLPFSVVTTCVIDGTPASYSIATKGAFGVNGEWHLDASGTAVQFWVADELNGSLLDRYVAVSALSMPQGKIIQVAGLYDGSGVVGGLSVWADARRVDDTSFTVNPGGYVRMRADPASPVRFGTDLVTYSRGRTFDIRIYRGVLTPGQLGYLRTRVLQELNV